MKTATLCGPSCPVHHRAPRSVPLTGRVLQKSRWQRAPGCTTSAKQSVSGGHRLGAGIGERFKIGTVTGFQHSYSGLATKQMQRHLILTFSPLNLPLSLCSICILSENIVGLKALGHQPPGLRASSASHCLSSWGGEGESHF